MFAAATALNGDRTRADSIVLAYRGAIVDVIGISTERRSCATRASRRLQAAPTRRSSAGWSFFIASSEVGACERYAVRTDLTIEIVEQRCHDENENMVPDAPCLISGMNASDVRNDDHALHD
jgi:hypothetical protein